MLIIVGNHRTLAHNKVWFEYLEFIKSKNLLFRLKNRENNSSIRRIMRGYPNESDHFKG